MQLRVFKMILIISLPLAFINCSSSSDSSYGAATQMSAGVDSAVSKIQSLGTAMGSGTSSFKLPKTKFKVFHRSSIHAQNAQDSCTVHASPGTDVDVDGEVEESEKYSASDDEFALQSFYCTMATDSDGPEAVSGAVSTVRMVTCALERQMGAIVFDGIGRDVSSITIDLNCADQADIDDMSGTTGNSSVTLEIPSTITALLNPTFPEIAGNTHYTHGIKIDGGSALTFILLAKFEAVSGVDPLESGDFEFATYGSGEAAGGGNGSEITAGRIDRTSATSGTLWYEFRANRIKSSPSDPICPGTESNCGWARHIRFKGDITFGTDGDVSDVENFTGIISNGNDATGITGGSNYTSVITATGSLDTGISGMVWTDGGSPAALNSGDVLGDLTPGTQTCIIAGGAISTSCTGAPAPLQPTDTIKAFLMPGGTTGDNSTWFSNLTIQGGIGYATATSMADEQFATP